MRHGSMRRKCNAALGCACSLQEQADQSARNSDQGIFFQGLSPYGNELYYPPEVRMVRGAHIPRPVGAGTGRD